MRSNPNKTCKPDPPSFHLVDDSTQRPSQPRNGQKQPIRGARSRQSSRPVAEPQTRCREHRPVEEHGQCLAPGFYQIAKGTGHWAQRSHSDGLWRWQRVLDQLVRGDRVGWNRSRARRFRSGSRIFGWLLQSVLCAISPDHPIEGAELFRLDDSGHRYLPLLDGFISAQDGTEGWDVAF